MPEWAGKAVASAALLKAALPRQQLRPPQVRIWPHNGFDKRMDFCIQSWAVGSPGLAASAAAHHAAQKIRALRCCVALNPWLSCSWVGRPSILLFSTPPPLSFWRMHSFCLACPRLGWLGRGVVRPWAHISIIAWLTDVFPAQCHHSSRGSPATTHNRKESEQHKRSDKLKPEQGCGEQACVAAVTQTNGTTASLLKTELYIVFYHVTPYARILRPSSIHRCTWYAESSARPASHRQATVVRSLLSFFALLSIDCSDQTGRCV